MKPSHRKDVIIARIIFAFLCLALLAIIISIIMLISSHVGKKHSAVQTASTQTESESEDTNVYEDIPVVTPSTEIVEQKVLVKTTDAVNLRKEADKESGVQVVIPEGTELVVLSELDGWAQVEYAGYSGYVFTEFIQQVANGDVPEDESDEEEVSHEEDAVDTDDEPEENE